MGVDIDPAGGHERAVRLNFPRCRANLALDGDNHPVLYRNIRRARRAAAAVDDRAAPNDQIEHVCLP